MSTIHLVIGPVGAGKSTQALRLARDHAALRLNLDEWMTTLFRDDRPDDGPAVVMAWYRARAWRCVDQIWQLTIQQMALGENVILEIGLLSRLDRERFYRRVDRAGFSLSVYVVDAPRELRRERVMQRNRSKGDTFSVHVPAAFFDYASDMWEPVEPDEAAARNVTFIHNDGPPPS